MTWKRRNFETKTGKRGGIVNYCDGKVMYDKRGAQTAANHRYKQDRVKLRIYPCGGDHWHLTKVEKNWWE